MHVLDPDRTDDAHERSRSGTADEDSSDHVRARGEPIDPTDGGVDVRGTALEATHAETDTAVVDDEPPSEVTVPPRRGLVRIRGMRIRRIRIWSVTKIAAVFFALGYAAVLVSGLLAWNLANQLGLIADAEDVIVSALGLETFEVAGGALFEAFAIVVGALTLFGFVVTVLLALIYNAATAVLGGIAVETGPLRRPRRVFSMRHRRFVKIS